MPRKKKHEESHGGSERWLITYADMITLLMVMFVVFFAMATVDLKKFQAAAESLREGFGASRPVTAGAAAKIPIFDEAGGETPLDGLGGEGGVTPIDIFEFGVLGAAIEEEIEKAFELEGVEGTDVSVDYNERGIVISISPDNILFDSGQADLKPQFKKALDAIGPILRRVPNMIQIEGHTDDRPISTARFPSNWELSTARATAVLRYLIVYDGIPENRLSAAGYADSRPVDPSNTSEARARNRRVEIIILRSARGADRVNFGGGGGN